MARQQITPDFKCDCAILGAGTAGLAAERTARTAGARTLLINDRFAGTTCGSVGCMPSKLLIAAAEAAHSVRHAHIFGIEAQEPAIDGSAVMSSMRKERDRFVAAVERSIAALPDSVAPRRQPALWDRRNAFVEDGRTITAEAIVIATGCWPSIPDIFRALAIALSPTRRS